MALVATVQRRLLAIRQREEGLDPRARADAAADTDGTTSGGEPSQALETVREAEELLSEVRARALHGQSCARRGH